jgi:F-type H+-transporting ATPase subunit a
MSGITVLASEGDTWSPPSLNEFFPGGIFFEGTPFEMNRIHLIALLMAGLLSLFFVLAFRNPQLVPRGLQNLAEMALDVVRTFIVDEILGAEGRKYTAYLTTLFFLILAWNVTGIIPFMNMPVSATIGFPAFLALTSYVVFNVAGIRAQGLGPYLSSNLFIPGVPKVMYILLTPIEFLSTFILRPITLALRLMVNMLAGHLMLVLFFSAAWYFIVYPNSPLQPLLGIGVFGAGFAFTLFESLIIVIQAYIFTLLTAVYIAGATSAHH